MPAPTSRLFWVSKFFFVQLLEHDVGASAQFQVAVAEPQRVVLVRLAFLLHVARKRVRLREQNGLLQRRYLRADVQQLNHVVVRRRRVALETQHLEEAALLALARYQHLHQPDIQYKYVLAYILRSLFVARTPSEEARSPGRRSNAENAPPVDGQSPPSQPRPLPVYGAQF